MRRRLTTAWRRGVLSVALLLGLAGRAYAVDGVIEINQALAKAGGVTLGDTPLFPVTLSQPGSYRLTGNLDVTDATARPAGMAAENTTAIDVAANGVTIDLNGFVIKGPTVCSDSPRICSPTGTGRGINAEATSGVKVLNGIVSGMGNTGMTLGAASQAENVTAVGNGRYGISADTVSGCTVSYNASHGILAQRVSGCSVLSNAGDGIRGGTVSGCTVSSNSGDGIIAFTVSNCTAFSNGDSGIKADTAIGCTAFANTGGDIIAKGANCQNVCGRITQCPGVCPTPGP